MSKHIICYVSGISGISGGGTITAGITNINDLDGLSGMRYGSVGNDNNGRGILLQQHHHRVLERVLLQVVQLSHWNDWDDNWDGYHGTRKGWDSNDVGHCEYRSDWWHISGGSRSMSRLNPGCSTSSSTPTGTTGPSKPL
ncbi:hypothetical protein M378DRAFT_17805 [Amanita muscaria Koide BX008]|uniref:Uncharacterized protein n=1 Tax=Amanita muscaria (strain Koide BX008) TaxID=946122 RepID=A0A0C2W3B7_AMAMK|nr:hypothetical protein M378DRAFT_17805 [Amanita muscaria Koide BX008]